jgi:integrase/recombinase XerD
MATDFAIALRRFLTSHLAGLRGCSPNTIASYRDTFKLLIAWFRDERSVPPGRLTLDHIDAGAVTAFLSHLQEGRHNSVSTRNQRLAAISSFSTWMQTEDPARMACWQDISAIPAKKQDQPDIGHLTVEQARRLLAQPDRSTRQGRRDATLLATLYDTGARVSELAGLAVRDIRLEKPAMASLTGKGRKTRHVPLTGNTITLLAAYLAEHRLDQPGRDDHPVFYGQHRDGLTRGGIAWIIRKYQDQIGDPPLAGAGISPHVLRHSKAPLRGRSAAALHPRHSRARRPVHHRDLRQSLDRGQAQGPRSRLPGHRHQRPARMEPGPRPARLARRPLIRPRRYAQRPPAKPPATRASRPALRITRRCA